MPVRVEKAAFNLREKINEMDGIVPYHKMPSGSILQVVQGRLTSQTESTASTNTRVTIGLEVAITPHFPSSKILVNVDSLSMRTRTPGSTEVAFLVQRRFGQSGDWVDHWAFAEYSGSGTTTGGLYNREYYPGTNYLDSAGTTQEISYRVQGYRVSGTANVAYFHQAGGGRGARNYCTITAMEVKQ